MEEERENREFWIISYQGIPERRLGYKCDGDFWWFPTARFSTNQTFENFEEARLQAVKEAEKGLEKYTKLLETLENWKSV